MNGLHDYAIRCRECGSVYSPLQWLRLPWFGYEPLGGSVAERHMALRSCSCGKSLLGVECELEPDMRLIPYAERTHSSG